MRPSAAVFRVQKLDGTQVWRRRHYRVRRAQVSIVVGLRRSMLRTIASNVSHHATAASCGKHHRALVAASLRCLTTRWCGSDLLSGCLYMLTLVRMSHRSLGHSI